jgi:hypothetical protein
MRKITLAVAFMCALSAYVSYPSAQERQSTDTLSPIAMAQASQVLPTEAYDAI